MSVPLTSVQRIPGQAEEASYIELRIHTLLLCRIVTLLSQLLGPIPPQLSQGSTLAWWPEDLTREVDQWRTDPNF